MATKKKPPAPHTVAARLSIEMAKYLTERELAQYGVFDHRVLGEKLEELGYPPYFTEMGKTHFLSATPAYRAQALHAQVRAYYNNDTRLSHEAQRIKDLELLLGESERRHKEAVEQKQLTIDSLREHKLALEGQIKALEEKVTLLTTDLELEKAAVEMHLDDSKRQDEHIADLKMAIRNLAVLI